MSGSPFKHQVELSPLGGTVVRWQHAGKDILFPRQLVAIEGAEKVRGGMHACFPNHGMNQARLDLPQHGPLRDLTGLPEAHERVSFAGPGILRGPDCTVVVSVHPIADGFEYRLSARLSHSAKEPYPTNAGLHPYFRTPHGSAAVYVDGEEIKVRGLLKNSRRVPFRGDAKVYLPGVGLVKISGGSVFREAKTAQLVLWRDSLDYLCVEPTLGGAAGFAQGNCPHLVPGRAFDLSCSFRLV